MMSYGEQDLKIESEITELADEDDLDLMLPTKKKKPKKVDFQDEGEMLEKDEGGSPAVCFPRLCVTVVLELAGLLVEKLQLVNQKQLPHPCVSISKSTRLLPLHYPLCSHFLARGRGTLKPLAYWFCLQLLFAYWMLRNLA